ncbi:hypothetical protein PMAYCL1PPCAC_04995, partial [Pristionchus mayeri]
INAVRSTPEDRKSLMELLSKKTQKFLCANHFLPSDFNLSKCGVHLKHNAVPSFTGQPVQDFADPPLHSSAQIKTLLTSSEIKEELDEIKDEPVDNLFDVKQEPVADVYCPSTGSSRLLYQLTPKKLAWNSTVDKSCLCPECGKK